jgi:adenylosuccinate lyase
VIARYSRPDMKRVWSEESRLARLLEVELAALDGWAEIGAVPADAAAEVRERAVPPTPERVAEIEERTQHDLAAFVDAVAEQLGPVGRPEDQPPRSPSSFAIFLSAAQTSSSCTIIISSASDES